jgi:sulfite reductase beta subunit-like hemoprotein
VAVPEDNSVEVHSQDIGLIALVDDGSLLGANVLVGGGLGLTHRKADTFARLGTPLCRVGSDDVVEIVRVIAEIFRDHGNRADRRHARLKYLIEDWGIDRFRREVRERADFELLPWRELPPLRAPDHLGSHAQADGRCTYGVPVANGRIIDGEKVRLKTALRKIVEAFAPEIILTPRQDLVFKGLTPAQVEKIEATLAAFGVDLPGALSGARRFALACPALPTCGLALSEAERAMPEVLEEIETLLRDLDLDEAPISVRMTGCPNGCARPYTSDIGFVGRRPGVYDIFVGGTLRGDRLADRYAQEVPVSELVSTLTPLLHEWRRERREGEVLGDFYRRRHGRGEERTILTGA